LATTLAGVFLVVLTAPFPLALRLGCIFIVSLASAYRSFRVQGAAISPRRAFLFSIMVGQVVAFGAWAVSVTGEVTEGVFAVMLLLAWYINRDVIRHTVEESFNRQVVIEYLGLLALLAYLFVYSYVPR
jgi:hypothetical protein